MLHLQMGKKDKRTWAILKTDVNNNVSTIATLNLINSSITNKFSIVGELFGELHELVPEFEPWFEQLLNDYITSSYNSEIILDNAQMFIDISKKYIEAKNIDFQEFYKIEKTSKTSISFLPEDIKSLAVSSTCLKLYSIICYDTHMKLPENIHKRIYETFIQPCIDNQTTEKIFKLIRSRIYRSSITDRYMWELIKMVILETPESYVMSVFNFLMINMLSTISIDRNPIPFIVSIIDASVRWMMRTVYRDRILYGDSFGGSEDIYGASLSKESFYLYCCNDVVGKAAKAGMDIMENEFSLTDDEFNKIRDRLDRVDSLIPPMKLLTLPIASKVLNIPYKFLLTCPPKHAMLMGILLFHISKGILDERFPVITEFLLSCPKGAAFNSTRSSYKVRNLEYIINDKNPIFGFDSTNLKFEIMSSICGVMSACKKDLISVITGKPLKKINSLNLEHNIITFFTSLYSNQMDVVFNKMKEKVDNYF